MAKKTTELPENEKKPTEPNEPPKADAAQMEAMADMIDFGEEMSTKESTDKEPEKGQPPDEKTADVVKQEEKLADSTGKKTEKKEKESVLTKEESQKKEKEEAKPGQEQKGKTKETEDLYEVKTGDGIKHVPASNLVSVYQQFHALQKKHEAIKPLLDLADQTEIPASALYAFLRYGVEKAMESQKKKQGPVSPEEEYIGPFKDKEEADHIKETDPTLFFALMNQWKRNQGILDEIQSLKISLAQGQQKKTEDNTRTQFTQIFDSFVSQHEKLFAENDENVKKFQEFLQTHFYHYPVKEVNEDFLDMVLSRFAPNYYKGIQMAMAKESLEKQRTEEKETFGESASVRSGHGKINLTEQQGHMADMFD